MLPVKTTLFGIVLFGSAMFIASGCCGGGGSTDGCTATLTYNGATGPGAGNNKAEAQLGACWKHCGDHDPTVDAAWKAWKSGGGKTAGSKFADLTDVPSLKATSKVCESQCAADIAAGKATITFGAACE